MLCDDMIENAMGFTKIIGFGKYRYRSVFYEYFFTVVTSMIKMQYSGL